MYRRVKMTFSGLDPGWVHSVNEEFDIECEHLYSSFDDRTGRIW
jgi:hypothetical protein